MLGNLLKKLRIRNQTVREGLAEFLGTTVLLLLGDGSVAQMVLGGKGVFNSFLSVNIAWGVAVAMGVYVSGGVSGGHINPAVTLTMAVFNKLSWWKVPVYFLGQYLGAILGSALIHFGYHEALANFDPNQTTIGDTATAGIFATYPSDYLSAGGGICDQIVGTGLLLLCVFAITDTKNIGAPKGMVPFCVGWAVVGIGACFGMNCGYAINPARDLGPRLYTLMAGWGNEPFSLRDYNWFWVPIIGPHLGGILGALLYVLCVEAHHPEKKDEYEETEGDIEKSGAVESSTGYTNPTYGTFGEA